LPVLLVGGGMFVTTWMADIATAAGISRTGGHAVSASPGSIELATLWLHDAYREAGLVRLRADLELGRLGLRAEGLRDAEGRIYDTLGEVRVRIYGRRATGELIADGSRLYVRGGLRDRQDDDFGLVITTGELEAVGRLDLDRIDPALAGTFAELSAGVGEEYVSYASTTAHDHDSLLLGGFAWGAYLGSHGELKIFYDHRRDGLVGGGGWFHTQGFVGSIGASIDWLLDPHWAVHAEVQEGTAWLTTFGIRWRGPR
jgi:hypothetical protein